MENFHGITDDDSDLRGGKGPLHVKNGENYLNTKLYETFIQAGDEAGYGETIDYNGIRQEGFGPMPATIFHNGPRKGERACAAACYLYPNGIFTSIQTPEKRGSELIKIETNSTVNRLLFSENNNEDGEEEPHVIGVECTNGKSYYSKNEVILCAGSIGSPQLLQCSGIGDYEKLKSFVSNKDYKLRLNLPGVGMNLQDHLEVYLQYQISHDSLQSKLSYFNKLLIGIQWFFTKKGISPHITPQHMPIFNLYLTPPFHTHTFSFSPSISFFLFFPFLFPFHFHSFSFCSFN